MNTFVLHNTFFKNTKNSYLQWDIHMFTSDTPHNKLKKYKEK